MEKIGGREMLQHFVMNVVEASGTAFEVGKRFLGFRQGEWDIERVRRYSFCSSFCSSVNSSSRDSLSRARRY